MSMITTGEPGVDVFHFDGKVASGGLQCQLDPAPFQRVPMLRVTEPTLAPLDGLADRLSNIWLDRNVSNQGRYARELESALSAWLQVPAINVVSSGTAALILMLAALDIEGEVITTPFTFVATSHAIRWAGLKPVFADIDAGSMTLDPDAVRRAITDRTAAILDVHLFGRPGHIRELLHLADRHHLKLIFDGAHAFGVRDGEGTLLRHGHATAVSFHATKVFNTIEGGAVVASDSDVLRRVARMRNFGFGETGAVDLVGLNAKLNEVQAAVGLANLSGLEAAIARRKEFHQRYLDRLSTVRGIHVPLFPTGYVSNYAYFPVLVGLKATESREALQRRLSAQGIQTRSYGFPLLSEHSAYAELASSNGANLPVAHSIASQVLCLPLHTQLSIADVDRVCAAIAAGT